MLGSGSRVQVGWGEVEENKILWPQKLVGLTRVRGFSVGSSWDSLTATLASLVPFL